MASEIYMFPAISVFVKANITRSKDPRDDLILAMFHNRLAIADISIYLSCCTCFEVPWNWKIQIVFLSTRQGTKHRISKFLTSVSPK